MLTHVGVFSVDFSRIDTGKTVCFLVSGGLSAVLSRVVYVNYSSVSIKPEPPLLRWYTTHTAFVSILWNT